MVCIETKPCTIRAFLNPHRWVIIYITGILGCIASVTIVGGRPYSGWVSPLVPHQNMLVTWLFCLGIFERRASLVSDRLWLHIYSRVVTVARLLFGRISVGIMLLGRIMRMVGGHLHLLGLVNLLVLLAVVNRALRLMIVMLKTIATGL